MDIQNFKSYYKQHYEPLLDKLYERCNIMSDEEIKERRLISFLKHDLEELLEELGG